MRLFRPFVCSGLLFPAATFRIKTKNKELCLSFDDGPDPGSTPKILDILKAHNIKAMFFCSGQKAENNPEIVDLILSGGHLMGNHGYRHLDGWKTSSMEYIKDISDADRFTSPDLFRPPYGRIRFSQYSKLVKKYNIVFWDLMPYDFDNKMVKDKALTVLKKKIRPGSIIVLHDSVKSTVLSFLEEFIDYAVDKGYKFVVPLFSGKN